MNFVHLRLHTEFSLVDSTIRIKPLMKAVVERGMPAIALTDQNNLFALVKFYRAAMGEGLKPIFGADILIDDEEGGEPFHAIFLCQNNEGYLNLSRLISKAYLKGQELGVAKVKRDWIAELSDGLIVLSGGRVGDVGRALISENTELVDEYLFFWKNNFPGRYYLELHRTNRENEEEYLHAAVELANQHDLPVVATNDVCFLSESDFASHEARVCIHDGYVLDDKSRPKNYSSQQYLRSAEEMVELFSDIPSAIENTVEIAKRCNVSLTLGKNYLPEFPIPEGMTEAEYFSHLSQEGLEERLDQLFDREADNFPETRKPYDERLQVELDVINQMGFPGYFLIVADFIQWAKDNGVPVGPGRGSGAGSLVAYALKITDLDPLEYDLLFERFLNPERVSMPDFDIDFCMDGRDRVIDYVSRTYGREKVSQIITYGTMAAKAVIRDVGRILSHPYGFVDRIAKQIPFEIGMTLTKALAESEDLKNSYDTDEEVKAMIDLALSLEGLTRNVGKHAGGVLISPSDLTDFTPLYCEEDGSSVVSQYDKNDVEAVGLVKFDFLGLRNLTIIDWALQTINTQKEKGGEEPVRIETIDLEDLATFDLLKAQKTTAVFQLESRGMKELIKRLQPDVFEDIVALVALYRPGPLQSGMVDDFINRKHGISKVEYPHPDLEPVLEPTYGVILYQEQVMQIAQVLAKYTLGGADMLRRAMGKKKPEEMEKQRSIFMEGAVANGVEADTATYIFDLMEKFAGYGFNKSHSAAYALVSFQTAWLKAHYPAAFMAAVLSADMDNTEKVVTLIDDCRHLGLRIIPPDINKSEYRFSVDGKDTVVYGLGAIKGVGEAAINVLLEERNNAGAFSSLANVCERVNSQKVTRRVMDTLVKAGAFDQLDSNRHSMMVFLPDALRMAEQHHRDKGFGQSDLFGGAMTISQDESVCPELPEWEEKERLSYEKETLDLYLTGHPILEYEPELKQFVSHKLVALAEDDGSQKHNKTPVILAGLVSSIRFQNTDKGKRAFIQLDDQSAYFEIFVFPDVVEKSIELIIKDAVLVVEGTLNTDYHSGTTRLRVNQLYDMTGARMAFARNLAITVTEQQAKEGFVSKLKPLIDVTDMSVPCPIFIHYETEYAEAELRLSDDFKAPLTDESIKELRKEVGQEAVQVRY